MTEKIAWTALTEAEEAMCQARDARNDALTKVREAIHALCCRDVGQVEYPRVQQEFIELCSGACDVSHTYRDACEKAAETRAAQCPEQQDGLCQGS